MRLCSVEDLVYDLSGCVRSWIAHAVHTTSKRRHARTRRSSKQLLVRMPLLGYRRIAAQLRREGHTVNTNRVRRLLKALGVQRKIGQVRVRTIDSSHPHFRYPNLVQGFNSPTPTNLA